LNQSSRPVVSVSVLEKKKKLADPGKIPIKKKISTDPGKIPIKKKISNVRYHENRFICVPDPIYFIM
jgi:hypothetical protein